MNPSLSPPADVAQLLERLARQLDTTSEVTHELLEQIGRHTGRRVVLEAGQIETIERQYRRLGGDHSRRFELLRLLAAGGNAESLAAFCRLVVDDPPRQADGATLAFVPLFQQPNWPVEAVFPAIFAALEHGPVAAVLLDLANFVSRQKLVAVHPAADRVELLAELLGRVVGILGRIEEHPEEFARTPQELAERVSEALSLVVALCDALGLIGNPAVCGKLYQARELRHRRVRVEAAAALARLGDPSGIETLIELAAEPVVRTRALAYLDELGELARAKPEHRTPAAQAEGALAAWLAQPMRYGIGPAAVEVVDQRQLGWPGFAQPVDCFLVRYVMPGVESPPQGIAVVGPFIAAAGHVDLADLNPEAIYAYYAGSSVEHEAIGEIPVDKLPLDKLAEWTQRKTALQQAGLADLQLLWWGRFFEYEHWVALAHRGEHRVVAIVDRRQTVWYPLSDRPRGLSPADWYALHKGRVMLETFNPAPDRPAEEGDS